MDAKEFGRYRLLELIGRGGMGQVFRAHDTVMNREVAIKVLSGDHADDPGFRERFSREAYTAARLIEPHIIPIHDTGEIDGRLYLVMPIIDGIDIGKAIQRDGAMDPARAVRMIEQIAAALDAAHAHGLVHRDVKPSNALIAGHEFVYLIDFGIAQESAASKLTTTGRIMGTFAYMAPERITTDVVDGRVDVYALACVLYECLTGEQPYPGDRPEQQIAAHVTLNPPQPSLRRPGVPVGFDDVIARGMAKDPDQRYQSAGDLAAAAQAALATPAADQVADTSHRSQLSTRSANAAELLSGESTPQTGLYSSTGSSTNDSAARAEYKQVTVLFADVVDSMEIAAAVGTERLREIMSDLVTRSAAVVQRYGGTVDKFTGNGIMAVFGAPIALEDHAIRACLAALGIQQETKRLAADVQAHDGVDLQLRMGLNSGQVIAGEMGSGPFGYTAVGEQVGMAQRMEGAAPAGGVLLSASTARLVDGSARLGDAELIQIRSGEAAVAARQLLGMGAENRAAWRAESNLVGRQWEMSAVEGLLDRAAGGRGAVVAVVGSPGVGKSRLVREVTAMAGARGVQVFATFCESHASDIPFGAVARLLRAITGVGDLAGSAARTQVRAWARAADPEDLLLIDDLLGIADPDVELPKIDPDARRRRRSALINAASRARLAPAVYVIEDAHWIDQVSESLLADYLALISRTKSMVLITYRPDYRGPLQHVPGAQNIALDPLSAAETSTLVGELLGADPSVGQIAEIITGRAAGNPFFAQEIIRELAERGVLVGERGGYSCRAEVADFGVPATVQAAIAARIDRLPAAAKNTLAAAAVIGSRFGADLLTRLGIDAHFDELIGAELIDQVRFTPRAEYAFHHPLIRSVAYETQLKADRAQTHRRLAAAIETGDPARAEQNAALISEHLEAAGDLAAAYAWHMRAAAWATNRDIGSARLSLERATKIADGLPDDDPGRTTMRIASRTMLCGIAWRVHIDVAGERFDELRELCSAAGDKASLSIAMAGLVMDHAFQARLSEASELASEAMALIESIGNPLLTVGLSFAPCYAKAMNAEWSDVLRWSETVIALADGDPLKGNFIFGSPLAAAYTARGIGRYAVGSPGWRPDLEQGIAMARAADPSCYSTVVTLVYSIAVPCGVLRADEQAMHDIEDALRIAERSGDDLVLALTKVTLGVALVHCEEFADRDRGQALLSQVSEAFLRGRHNLAELPAANVYLARERARCGNRADALAFMRDSVDQLFRRERLLAWAISATGVLVETLLEYGTDSDVAHAEAAVERLAAARTNESLAMRDIWLLRMRALLARARGDVTAYPEFRDRYREMAETLGFEGHIAWAEAMPRQLSVAENRSQ